MILYANGDEHSAAVGAANPCHFANDDIHYVAQGKRPHPDNLALSWSMSLSKTLSLGLKCHAESLGSNDRMLRTTLDFMQGLRQLGNPYLVIVIGWTRWDREEWLDEDTDEWYQVTRDNLSELPTKWIARHRRWAREISLRDKSTEWHGKIHDLHTDLLDMQIPHVFFNSTSNFDSELAGSTDWHGCYLAPYDKDKTFMEWSRLNGLQGSVAQRKWSDVLFSQLTPLLHRV